MAKISAKYEVLYIIDPDLGEEGIAALVEKFKALVEAEGTLTGIEEWGKRRLAYLINKAALTSRHIAAREITEPNEKYAMRCWLVRLGMTGEDLKFDRAILLSHLNGNSAFRTDRDKEVWLSRRNKKKDIIGNRIASLLSSDVGTLRLAARA